MRRAASRRVTNLPEVTPATLRKLAVTETLLPSQHKMITGTNYLIREANRIQVTSPEARSWTGLPTVPSPTPMRDRMERMAEWEKAHLVTLPPNFLPDMREISTMTPMEKARLGISPTILSRRARLTTESRRKPKPKTLDILRSLWRGKL
jgi:hypothetical protein